MISISILACGWLGLPLAKSFVNKGFDVKGSTTQFDKLNQLSKVGIDPYHLNFQPSSSPDLINHFFDADILIVNLPPRNRNGDPDYHRKQLSSIINHAKDGQVKHVLFVSSTSVYKNFNREVFEHEATMDVTTRGGVSLLEMEGLFTQDESFKTTVLRFSGLIGPNRHPANFLAGKTNLQSANAPINLIHLDDCIHIIHTILDQNIWGETFHASCPHHPSRKDFYTAAALAKGLVAPQFQESDDLAYKIINNTHLQERTGYSFLHDNLFDCL